MTSTPPVLSLLASPSSPRLVVVRDASGTTVTRGVRLAWLNALTPDDRDMVPTLDASGDALVTVPGPSLGDLADALSAYLGVSVVVAV